MSETDNIAGISQILSGKLFNYFGWTQTGPINFNFSNNSQEDGKRKKFPCDVIFSYVDPFSKREFYLLTDLKSYAKNSLNDNNLFKNNITHLCSALQCARFSRDFQNILPENGGTVNALLFIYNHDNEYDKDFPKILESKVPPSIVIPTDARVYIFGPSVIQFLIDIVNDLEKVFGEETDPVGVFSYFYPNMNNNVPEKNYWSCATPEMLLSPYVIVSFEKKMETRRAEVVFVETKRITNFYYLQEGSSYEEFCFIFDYCFRYNLVDDNCDIRIKLPNACADALTNFEKAKKEFSKHFYRQDSGLQKLTQISFHQVLNAKYKFHDRIVGMERRKEFANAH